MTLTGDFFNRAGGTLPKPAAAPAPAAVAAKLKQLQCAAMWQGWRLSEVEPGGFAFVSMNNEGERYPLYGALSPAEVERFIHAREKERRW